MRAKDKQLRRKRKRAVRDKTPCLSMLDAGICPMPHKCRFTKYHEGNHACGTGGFCSTEWG